MGAGMFIHTTASDGAASNAWPGYIKRASARIITGIRGGHYQIFPHPRVRITGPL